jgi:cytoskeletal protein CcmA (bactofilin family)
MFSWFKKPEIIATVTKQLPENVIARGTRIRGELEGELGFRIDGTIDGTILSEGRITVGTEGEVLGNIRAESVVILGHVEGNIVCEGHLEIGATGRVVGDITMKSIQVHQGGVFAGTSRMTIPSGTKSLAPARLGTLPPPEYAAVPPQAAPTPVSSRARIIRPGSNPAPSGSHEELRRSGTDDDII